MAFLEIKNVCKGYGRNGDRTEVLRDVNLSIERGEFVAIVGYSGAGKTTLISMLAGLAKPDSGSVLLDGKEVRGPSPERAVVFQNYSLLPWMSVYQNVYLAVDQVFGDWPIEKKQRWTREHVETVNLL